MVVDCRGPAVPAARRHGRRRPGTDRPGAANGPTHPGRQLRGMPADGRPPARDGRGAAATATRRARHGGRARGPSGRPRSLARPFVDVDLAALQAAGLDHRGQRPGRGGANVSASAWPPSRSAACWLSGPTLGAEAARLAVQLGIGRGSCRPRPSTSTPIRTRTATGRHRPATPGVPGTPVRLGDGGPLAVVSDTRAGRPPRRAATAWSAAHRFVAELTTTWLEAPSDPPGVAVRPARRRRHRPRSWPRRGAGAERRPGRAGRAARPDLPTIPPGGDGPETVDLAPHEVTDDLRPAGPRGSRPRAAGSAASPACSTTRALADVARQSLLMSTGAATPDAPRPAYVDRVNAELADGAAGP